VEVFWYKIEEQVMACGKKYKKGKKRNK